VGVVRRFTGHTAAVHSVALSRHGRYALSGGADGTVRLWDAQTGQLVRPFDGTGGVIRSVAFSTDGKHALAAGDGRMWEWEVDSGNLVSPANRGYSFEHLVFAGDGRSAWMSGANGFMTNFTTTEGRFRRSIGRQEFGPVRPLALSQDERLILFVSRDEMAHLWVVDGSKEVPLVWKTPSPVLCGAFALNGLILATGGADRVVRLWDLRTRREARLLKGHTDRVTSVAFSADGRQVASASEDGTVRVWSVRTGQLVQLFDWHTDKVLSVAFSADGRRIVSGGSDKTVRVWALPKP
jgi:WD40 repeat protein